MIDADLEIRMTRRKGRGVFARKHLGRGQRVLAFQGRVLATTDLTDDLLAMQIDHDRWLCSDGSLLDDCVNHSCVPNTGFLAGDLVLYALCDIAPGEEITWDYSTSIAERGWTLECCCEEESCRKVIRSWFELFAAERTRLRPTALRYLRDA